MRSEGGGGPLRGEGEGGNDYWGKGEGAGDYFGREAESDYWRD